MRVRDIPILLALFIVLVVGVGIIGLIIAYWTAARDANYLHGVWEEIKGPCIVPTGKTCAEEGVQNVTRVCVPHPHGFGCSGVTQVLVRKNAVQIFENVRQ